MPTKNMAQPCKQINRDDRIIEKKVESRLSLKGQEVGSKLKPFLKAELFTMLGVFLPCHALS